MQNCSKLCKKGAVKLEQEVLCPNLTI